MTEPSTLGRESCFVAWACVLIFGIASCSGARVFTQRNGLTGEIAAVVAGSPDTVWVYSYYQIPSGSGYEVIGGVSEFKALGNWTTYTKDDGLASAVLYSIAIDGDSVWFGTANGATLFDRSKGTWRTFKTEDGLISNDVLSVATGADRVWLGTKEGVSMYDRGSGKWSSFTEKDGLIFRYVKDVALDGDVAYFATSQGLGRFDSAKGDWSSITKENGLRDNMVNCVVVGFDSIWLGTGTGVSRLARSTGSWAHYGESDGLPPEGALAAAVGPDAVWFLTRKGVARFDPAKEKWTISDKGLPATQTNDIATGKRYVWVATNKGLVRLGGGGLSTLHFALLAAAVCIVVGGTYAVRRRGHGEVKVDEPKRKVPERPPHVLCGGNPAAEYCPRCKYNVLKGGSLYCNKYDKKVDYAHPGGDLKTAP